MIHIAVKHNIAKEYLDKGYPPNQRHFEKNNNEDAKINDMKDIKIQNLEKSLKKCKSPGIWGNLLKNAKVQGFGEIS